MRGLSLLSLCGFLTLLACTGSESGRGGTHRQKAPIDPPALAHADTTTRALTTTSVVENGSGFEHGDFRSFRPRYVGASERWIRHGFGVSGDDPIRGARSLTWSGSSPDDRWLFVSNAFYLRAPLRLSARVRLDRGSSHVQVGLGIAEDYDGFAGIRIEGRAAHLHRGGTGWDESADSANADLRRGRVYELSIRLGADGSLRAVVRPGDSDRRIASLEGRTSVRPRAVALFLGSGSSEEARVTVDEVRIASAPYRVPENRWVRSPRFVVLPRPPEVEQDQGNWVGGHSIMKDEEGFKMWYRIRSSAQRGAGYGYATSEDGVHWRKSPNNPVLRPDTSFASNEKISVLRTEGRYRAWYAVDVGDSWAIAYATSANGTDWNRHGLVIRSRYAKDPEVLYVDGRYYLYAIAPTSTELAVFTSEDGANWNRREVREMGAHFHPAAYYLRDSDTFWLYAHEDGQGVLRASSRDGVDFGPFTETWTPPPIGLDDWRRYGIDYGSFPEDRRGHLESSRRLLMYYQARNEYRNHPPGWRYHGGERIVLAGRFRGLYEGVRTTVREQGGYRYHAFPVTAASVAGLEMKASSDVRVTVRRWNPRDEVAARGVLRADRGAILRVPVSRLRPARAYVLTLDGAPSDTVETDADGRARFRTELGARGERPFSIELLPR